MENITASILFSEGKHRDGENKCFFCGASCGDFYLSKNYIKETFTNRDVVKAPSSKYVCIGCVESLGEGEDSMLMIDGSIKQRTNARGMCPRMYSWILTKDKKLAFTKAHIAIIRDVILNNLPQPPFSIILTDSGQKQLIFRAPVAMEQKSFPILLEEEAVIVNVDILRERISMSLPVVAALGKPALTGEINHSAYIRYEEYHGNLDLLEKWENVKTEQISRLAAWLTKNKEEAQVEYPRINK